jgi:hypothetical protein
LPTQSFGWISWECFSLHDCQEFMRVLLDKLTDKTRGTTLESVIPDLFRGRRCIHVRAMHVDWCTEGRMDWCANSFFHSFNGSNVASKPRW